MIRNKDLSLILPVHNQESIILPVVKDIINKLTKSKINYEIILVENGSQDKTYKILKKLELKNANIKVYTAQKGYGSAIIAGLNKARGKYVCYMPSDGQLDSSLISQLYNIIIKESYDLVKIKRVTRESIIRSIRSKLFNLLTRLCFSINIKDINGSPRIFLRKWLRILNLQYKDSFIDTEMALKAYCLNWKVKEIPAKTLPRLGGKSTVSVATVIEFMRNLITYKFGPDLPHWLKRTRKQFQISF